MSARGGRGTKPARIRRSRRSQTPGSARGGRGTLAAKKNRARAQKRGAFAGRRGSSGGRCVPDVRAAEGAAHKNSLECLGAQSDLERSLADRAQRTEHRRGRFKGAPRVGPGHDPKVWMEYPWKSPKRRPGQGRRKSDTRDRDPRGRRSALAAKNAHCDLALPQYSTGRTEGKGRLPASQRGIQPAKAATREWGHDLCQQPSGPTSGCCAPGAPALRPCAAPSAPWLASARSSTPRGERGGRTWPRGYGLRNEMPARRGTRSRRRRGPSRRLRPTWWRREGGARDQ